MSRHTPIAGELSYSEAKLTGSELNKTRKPWDAAKPYEITQSPDPAFKLGSGMTDDVSLPRGLPSCCIPIWEGSRSLPTLLEAAFVLVKETCG